ncbi:MAG: hypothetical protein Q9162_002852 [Coniocarpon cinnabarinum]
MAATQETLQATQDKIDPRRLGRNNSGLTEQDVADVVCILHPCSVAAFEIVADTALRNPQHILQNQGLTTPAHHRGLAGASAAETILLPATNADGPRDLALRFSSRVIDPTVGFCFGRNVYKCDISLDPHGNQKRVSNTHFRIFLNNNGVLMLADMSTNGTVVDGDAIGGKKKHGENMIQRNPTSRMLVHGAVIEVLSPTQEEIVKFILRLPSRDGLSDLYKENFQSYVQHVQIARDRALATKRGLPMPEAHARAVMAAPLAGPANTKAIPTPAPQTMSSGYPMHWDGGSKYNCIGMLGKGAFATVYQIATTYGGDYYAAKELDKKRFMKNNQLDTRLENEMNIMQELRHENIVQYMDFVETKTHLYIIMEFVSGGDLQGYMQSHATLHEDPAKDMTRQILDALQYLHQRNITHRDIKPDNILLCSEAPFVVKLTDFGLSKVVKNNETFLKTFCGTLLYCAPEVFPHYQGYMADKRPKRRRASSQNSNRRSYSQLVDIWSYAAVLWTALCGKPPFEGVVDAEGKGMFYQIMQSSVDPQPLKECGVSDSACDLLLLMLDTDPTSRPSETECLRHPWLNGGEWLPEPEGQNGQLHAIDESDEVDIDASDLRIDDKQEQTNGSSSDGNSLEAPDPKRARGEDSHNPEAEAFGLRNGYSANQPSTAIVIDATQPPRLFGEISQQALKSSGALNAQTGHFDAGFRASQPGFEESWNDSSNNSGDADSRILDWGLELSHKTGDENATAIAHLSNPKAANTSLSGTTSIMRELQMADLPLTTSMAQQADVATRAAQQAHSPEPYHTPNNQAQGRSAKARSQEPVEKTPRQRKPFERQISLPITASSYYNPYDEATHSLEYASQVSGHDFAIQSQVDKKGVTSLPETIQASFRSDEEADVVSNTTSTEGEPMLILNNARQVSGEPQAEAGARQVDTEFLKPATGHGRLVSTSDSFAAITLFLVERQTSWGRLPGNTITYPNSNDTRIPKQALELVFDAPGASRAEAEGRDWTSLPGLRLLILTRSRHGVWVNGSRLLQHDEKGRRYYGRLADGDVVEVFRPPNQTSGYDKPLKFTVEIGVEAAKWQRKEGKNFEVQKHSESAQ